MTPTTNPPAAPAPPARPRRRKPGRRVLLRDVDWETYEKLLAAFAGRRNVRLTYDRGNLEIMAPISSRHEGEVDNIGALVGILAEEFGLPLRRGGGFTMKNENVKSGIEPDRCYWVASAAKLAGVIDIDLAVHHPPDLAVEVDVTNSSLNKMSVYAKLGVAELWRLDGNELRFYQRGPRGKYREIPTSLTFAGITPADLMIFLQQTRGAADQTVATKAFREWVRQRVAAQAAPPIPPAS